MIVIATNERHFIGPGEWGAARLSARRLKLTVKIRWLRIFVTGHKPNVGTHRALLVTTDGRHMRGYLFSLVSLEWMGPALNRSIVPSHFVKHLIFSWTSVPRGMGMRTYSKNRLVQGKRNHLWFAISDYAIDTHTRRSPILMYPGSHRSLGRHSLLFLSGSGGESGARKWGLLARFEQAQPTDDNHFSRTTLPTRSVIILSK
jgi:hypothetical protein